MYKLTINEIIALEEKYHLWEYKLFKYPLWIHCREPLLSTGIMVNRKINRPSIFGMVKSFLLTMKFLFTQKKYEKVFFLMGREELLEIYKIEKDKKKILFLNHEQEKIYAGNDYISSDFFNLLRYISRKFSFMVFHNRYKTISRDLKKIHRDIDVDKYIKIAIGDAVFLKFLSLILSKENEKIYTGSVIPMGEKFINYLNSFEVQHGVIHTAHTGYISIPSVKNTLILYDEKYLQLLVTNGYNGKLIVQHYKKTFFEKKVVRHFPIVIYTQPILKMQQAINKLIKENCYEDIYIQKHPKDYFEYELEKKYFITATTPFEVEYPIMYVSSIIENFTLYHKNCYIYDIKYENINIEDILKIYMQASKSKLIIENDLNHLFKIIKDEQSLKTKKEKTL